MQTVPQLMTIMGRVLISSIADRDEGRQTARWADGHKWTQSIKQFVGWMEINRDM